MSQFTFDYQKQPGRTRTRFYAPDPGEALVSVITPYYNAGRYFEQTFNSVVNQTFPWFEWIIVNDGSTNAGDVAILRELAAKDRRITVIDQENGGLSCARNTGVAHTNTELVVPLDADDVFAPTYLECMYWAMLYNPDAAWCYTSSYGFHDLEYIWQYPFNAEKLKTYNFLNYTAMIRKKDLLEIGGWKVEKQSYYEDWRFWLEMLTAHKKPIHVHTCLFWYRRLDSGMLSNINKDPKRVEFCNKIIQKAGENADTTIRALEFPVNRTAHPYHSPEFIPWNRTSSPKTGKRVLWLTSWLNMGGADKFNLDAIAGLKEKGFENFILTTQPSENEWRQRFEDYTDEIFALPDFLDPAHYPDFLSYFIQSREIDVLMLTNSYAGYYITPWLRKQFPELVIVDYVHMEEWYWRAGGYARTAGNLGGITEKTYVCNSGTKRVLENHFGRSPESVDCLHIGVDHAHFSPEKEAPGYLHKLLKLPEERPIILFPCRVHPQKRPFMMLDIAQGVKERMPQAAFVIAGDGPQLEELMGQVRSRQLENTVYSIGSTDKMRECYRDSALTLICSLKEGLALTAYESLSMAVPVVSSDVGGQSDLIGSDVGALLPLRQREEDIDRRCYDPAEVEDFVSSICRILGDETLRTKLGQTGREKIVQGFGIDSMVDTLHRELESLCTDPRRAQLRRQTAEALPESLAGDYYTMYLLWEGKNAETEEVWSARCWFEKQWQQAQAELDAERNASFFRLCRRLLGKIKRRLLRMVGR